ncbi:MAG: hypothetical protein ACRC6A_10005 [Fusobacteriaceae bacterium]
MKEAKVEKLYIEKVSGKDIEGRPEPKNMLELVRELERYLQQLEN